MVDEEFYIGKKSEGLANPVEKTQPEPSDSPSSAPDGSEKPKNGSADEVKFDKKTKWIYITVFIALICLVMAGGVILASNRTASVTPSTPAMSVVDPAQLLTQESVLSTTPSAPVPTESAVAEVEPTTVMPTSVTTAAQTSAVATTEPLNTEAVITRFDINTDEFNRLAKILYGFGFVYDANQNMFYSHNDPWQRNMGYTSLYDDLAVVGDMYFDTIRFTFKYGDKKWLYQIWKGRYGVTAGCEMGIYYQDRRTDNKRFYDVPTDEDPLPGMYFELYRYGDFLFKNGPATHWWLTGFRLLDSSGSDALHMKMKYFMPNREICDAFEAAVIEQCAEHANLTYSRKDNEISISWAY